MHRRSDYLSTRLDEPNTLTHQSDVAKGASGDPTSCPDYMESFLNMSQYATSISTSTSTVPASPPLFQSPRARLHIKSPPIASSYLLLKSPSLASSVFHKKTVSTQFESMISTLFDSGFPYSVQSKVFHCTRLIFTGSI